MSLPDSYTIKPNAIPAYFDAILDANPPDRFSIKFLENLGFSSTNDRLFIGILKDLRFINADSTPQQRYFDFLDRSQSKLVLAQGIREAYSALFDVNTRANELDAKAAKNKLRTLYAGRKTDLVVSNIAKTFVALCQYADFSAQADEARPAPPEPGPEPQPEPGPPPTEKPPSPSLSVGALQYHINIVLPESRDQAVYDAIFKSLREHLR